MRSTARLLLPPAELTGCIFAAIVRDTRSVVLKDVERFNFFPSSPLFALSLVLEGEVRLLAPPGGLEAARNATPLPAVSVMPPQVVPTVSWCPGPVLAVTAGLFPDALLALDGRLDLQGLWRDSFAEVRDLDEAWSAFCNALLPHWRAVRTGLSDYGGSARLDDWLRALLTRAALSGPGKSVRSLERRIARLSGHSRRTLDFYAGVERLHRLSAGTEVKPLAELAIAGGFSDQSHMGRAVRRATGFSPADLNRRIEAEEPFWCYRLLGERF